MARSNRLSKSALVASLFVAANAASGQTLLWSYPKGGDLDRLDDFNGDGVGDVVILEFSGGPIVLSGKDGSALATYSSTYLASNVAGLDDQDGDGVPDLLVGVPWYTDIHGWNVGEVLGISGATGAQFYSDVGYYTFVSGDTGVGVCVSAMGDTDGDGLADFAYGVSSEVVGGWPSDGEVRVRSKGGASGLHATVAGSFDDNPGVSHALARLEDIDGDGASDFAAGVMQLGSNAGEVEIRSGKTGALIRSIPGPAAADRFGDAVRTCGDQDGDGIRDLIVGAPQHVVGSITPGSVMIYSSATGTLLREIDGVVDGGWFGADVDGLDDVDGDGIGDVVVASWNSPNGWTQIFSGATGAELERIENASFVRNVGDLDGDGHDDIAVIGGNGVDAWHVAPILSLDSVSPSRVRYDHVGSLALHGAGFNFDPNLMVLINSKPATNVTVTSYSDLTCNAPAGLLPGSYDVTVTNKFGTATLADGLLLTPAMFIDGDPKIGSKIYLRYEFDPLDSTFAIYGLPPQQSIRTPPFGGLLGIVPFFPLFTLRSYPSDEFSVHVNIPNDPALSGVTVLFQSLTGPNFDGHGKDAAWSNVAVLAIH